MYTIQLGQWPAGLRLTPSFCVGIVLGTMLGGLVLEFATVVWRLV